MLIWCIVWLMTLSLNISPATQASSHTLDQRFSKHYHEYESPEGLVKLEGLIFRVWSGAEESAVLTGL